MCLSGHTKDIIELSRTSKEAKHVSKLRQNDRFKIYNVVRSVLAKKAQYH